MPAFAPAPLRGIVAVVMLAGAGSAAAEIVVRADRGSGVTFFSSRVSDQPRPMAVPVAARAYIGLPTLPATTANAAAPPASRRHPTCLRWRIVPRRRLRSIRIC